MKPRVWVVTRSVLDPALSLGANLERLVATRLRRGLEEEERTALRDALDEGLSVLQAGGAEVRQQLLTAQSTVALASPGAAQLWACCLEASEGEVASVASLSAAISAACSAIAGVLFAASLGV